MFPKSKEGFGNFDCRVLTMQDVLLIIMIPFAGTVLGAACVFFVKGGFSHTLESALSGFAAGVMVAASVFSLLIPAIESSSDYGFFAALPAIVGLFIGFLLLLGFDRIARRLFAQADVEKACELSQNTASRHKRVFLLTLAVTIHNLPEGMAVGVALAGLLAGESGMTFAAVLVLAMGVGIQNIPEGTIISLPLSASGMKKGKAFGVGVLSGVVEPVGAALTLLAAGLVVPILPYLLGFAAGAMLSVVVTELVPATSVQKGIGTMSFALGFAVMTFLDVALG